MAVVVDIADAVVSVLNAGSFSQQIAAERTYLPQFDLTEMKGLRVTVVPRRVEIESGGRSRNQHDVAVDVAVQKKLEQADNTEIDALMDLVDEVADYFRFKPLEAFPDAVWIKTDYQVIYAQEHLQEMRQFTSVLTFTFRVMR